jgi:hypothetical protein
VHWSRRSNRGTSWGKTRRRLTVELIAELETIDKKMKAADKDLRELVIARGSTLLDLHGIGPSGAARLLADVGDIHRFTNRDRFASRNGTAPLDASSRRTTTTSLIPRGQPQNQPDITHHGSRSTPQPDRGPRLFRRQKDRGQDVHGSDARTETTTLERCLRTYARRP